MSLSKGTTGWSGRLLAVWLATLTVAPLPDPAAGGVTLPHQQPIPISSPDLRLARSLAISRLRLTARCRELFEAEGADGVRLLNRARFRRATDNEQSGICRPRRAALFTTVSGVEVVVCPDEFRSLGLSQRAALLLHEGLHHAGVGEQPWVPDALSSAQLTRLVEEHCSL